MQRSSTHFLRFIITLIGIGVLALCIFALPSMYRGGYEEFPMANQALVLIMIGLYITAIPFFVAVWQTFKLLNSIDRDTAFSETTVRSLKMIKYCAAIIGILYVAGVPLLIPIADAEDAPGMVVMGLIISFAPIAIAVFAALLQRLLQSALAIKSENDLTV